MLTINTIRAGFVVSRCAVRAQRSTICAPTIPRELCVLETKKTKTHKATTWRIKFTFSFTPSPPSPLELAFHLPALGSRRAAVVPKYWRHQRSGGSAAENNNLGFDRAIVSWVLSCLVSSPSPLVSNCTRWRRRQMSTLPFLYLPNPDRECATRRWKDSLRTTHLKLQHASPPALGSLLTVFPAQRESTQLYSSLCPRRACGWIRTRCARASLSLSLALSASAEMFGISHFGSNHAGRLSIC